MTTAWKIGDRCRVRPFPHMGSAALRLAQSKRLATVTALFVERGTVQVQFDRGRAKIPTSAIVGIEDLGALSMTSLSSQQLARKE